MSGDNGQTMIGAGGLSAGDLAEILREVGEVTARLHDSHEALQREVARLRAELGEANENLQRSRRLAALGEMAAGIAHEIRNPLGAIALSARMLEQGVDDASERSMIARRIGDGVRGLDAIVRDVLSFARDLKPRREAIDAEDFLRRVAQCVCVGELGESVRLEIDAERESGQPISVWGDPGMLTQALVNVARNALEAMEEVPAGARVLRLTAARDGASAAICVSDSGPGIDGETLDRMFNPFFTTRASGTGLGLAIVHRIIDAHGGSIRVRTGAEAELGRGTTFEIRLAAGGREMEPITVIRAGLEHAA